MIKQAPPFDSQLGKYTLLYIMSGNSLSTWPVITSTTQKRITKLNKYKWGHISCLVGKWYQASFAIVMVVQVAASGPSLTTRARIDRKRKKDNGCLSFVLMIHNYTLAHEGVVR
jgi:hypothetical protein